MGTTQRMCKLIAGAVAVAWAGLAIADETCNSPYTTRLIKGQEDYVHVWTLGVEGMGDGSDKLVTIGANPKAKDYGKVVHTLSVGGRGEAHHMGFTDDRRTCGRAASTTRRSTSSTSAPIRRSRSSCARSPISRRRPASSGRTRSTRCPAA